MPEKAVDGLLHVRLLGGLALRRDGHLLTLPASRRTRALLGYLVATAAPQTRPWLCDLLWDGPEDPRASLRWSLTKLRAIVDDQESRRLIADRDRVGFEARHCEVDVESVRGLLTVAGGLEAVPVEALERVAGLLQTDFLEGLDLPDCYRFHHWCLAERERYGALRRQVLEALVTRLSREPDRALPYGHAMVAADPLTESAHASLVCLFGAAGRYPEAERHYEWARDLLRREVGIPPGGLLDDAIRRLRRERRGVSAGSAPRQQEAPAVQTSAASAPIVGRTVERRAIAEAVGVRRDSRLLLFTGEPGIGKTRLLDEFAAVAAAAGLEVLRGRCFQAEMVRPYGLWLDVLRGVRTEGLPPEAVAQAAPLLAGQALEGGNRDRLFGAANLLLRGLAVQRPLAVALDDLQWVDEGSAALLHFLVRTNSGRAGLLLAGTARSGEAHDNPCASGLLQSLAREGGVQTVALAPMTPSEADALVGSAPLDARAAWRQSGGNALYLSELIRAARGGADPAGQPLDSLIHRRLHALDDSSADLLGWAAAAGRGWAPELLAEAAGLPVPEVLSRLGRLERHGLVRPTVPGGYDFAHDVVRQALYRLMSAPRRRAVHRQFVRALGADAGAEPALRGEIVHHAERAGDIPAAAEACLAAGEFCLRMFANVQAGNVAERGLAHVGTLPYGAPRVRLEIGLLRLRVAAAAVPGARRLPALSERIERTIAMAEALGLHAVAASGWELLAFWRQQSRDSGRTTEATLAAERMTRRADATTRCLQLANSGRCLLDIEADPARGRALLEEAAVLAAELELTVMEIEWGRGLAARADGNLDEASAALSRAVGLARLAENHWREFECTVWLAMVELERGHYPDVLQHTGDIIAAAGRMGEPEVPFARALAALARRRLEDASADALLEAALAELRHRDDKVHLAYALNEAAALALEAGRLEAAAEFAREALAAAQAVRQPTEAAVAAARLAHADPQGCRRAPGWPAESPAGVASTARAAGAIRQAATVVPTLAPTLQA